MAPRITLLVVALLAAPVDLPAQEKKPVAPGDRVRVTTATRQPTVATVLAVKQDTLVLNVESRSEPVDVRFDAITRLEVSCGKRPQVAKGALIGGTVTGGLVLALGLAAQGGDGWVEPSTGDVAKATVVWGAAGALAGALIGPASSSDRWEEVPLDAVRVSPPRGIVFVSVRPPEHEGEEIYSINPDGTGERRLTYPGDGKNSNIPQWSPDGTLIAFASNREDDAGRSSIYVMDGDGTDVRRLTPVGSRDYFPHWSPDGTKIAFMSSRDGDEEIYVMSPDGSNLQKLTDNDVFDAAYSWSPDGRLVFTSERDGTPMIYIMDADGSDVQAIGPGWGGEWQRDKDHIWYMDYPASQESGLRCYGVLDLDGTVVEQGCADDPVKHGGCGYSPDGTQVAFTATPDGVPRFPVTEEESRKREVYVANADGSNVRRLTFNYYYDGHCSW